MPQGVGYGPPISHYGQDPYPLESGTTTTVGEGGAGQSARGKALLQSMMIQKLLGASNEFGGGGSSQSLTPIPQPGGMRSPGIPAPAQPFNPMGAPIGMGRPSEISGGLTGPTSNLSDARQFDRDMQTRVVPPEGQIMPGGMTGNTSPNQRDIQMLLQALRRRGGSGGGSGLAGGTGF